MYLIEDVQDISNVIPKGVNFKVEKKQYDVIYNFRAIKRLIEIYGGLDKAVAALRENKDPYDVTVNFLYAALCDEYKLKKQAVEEWIGPGSVNLLYNVVFSAFLLAFGDTKDDEEQTGGEPGEV